MPDFPPAPATFRSSTSRQGAVGPAWSDLAWVTLASLVLGLVLAGPAAGQSDTRALDALGPAQKPHSKPTPHRHSTHHGHASHTPAPAAATVAAAPSPTIPPAPPPLPVIRAPLINVPQHPEPPPPPVPVVAGAAGTATYIAGGSRITFGSGSADLNPATMQALQAFAAAIRAEPEARAEIDAYGSGTADDPSTPRRLSLSRGLAARAVLINGGVASTRIYVRAIGQPHDAGPADRIDVIRSDAVQSAAATPTPPRAPDRPDAIPGKAATTTTAPTTTGAPTAP